MGQPTAGVRLHAPTVALNPPAPATPVSVPAPAPAPAPKTYRYYWEDFPVGSVREFGAMTVTREASINFAREFDPQPFHVDDEAARGSLFGALCTSGWHTCAMAMRMMCDDYLLETASLGSPGIDELRWLKPVFPGDTLRGRVEILEARPMASRPGVGLVRSAWQLSNQQGEAVLSMKGWGMYRRRPVKDAASDAAPDALPPPPTGADSAT